MNATHERKNQDNTSDTDSDAETSEKRADAILPKRRDGKFKMSTEEKRHYLRPLVLTFLDFVVLVGFLEDFLTDFTTGLVVLVAGRVFSG